MTVTQTVVREFEIDLVVRDAEPVAAGRRGDDAGPTRSGAALPDWTPGAHIDLILGDGLDPPVLAVRRTERHRLLAGRGAAGTRQPRRLRRCTSLAAGSTGPRARPPQPLPGRGRQALPLRRGRDRHHPAARDDLRGRGGRRRRGSCTTAGARGRRWPSSRSSRQFGDRVHLVPEDEAGRLDLDAILGRPRRRHPRLHLRAGAPARGRRGTVRRLAGREPAPGALLRQARPRQPTEESSFELVLQRSGKTMAVRRTSRCSRSCARPASASSARASRASAAPARPRSSTATSTTATRSSTTRSASPTR